MSDRYYQEELRYLTEAAKEFAKAFPEQSRLLSVDSVSDRDPYVERLFEGFAFLAGRVKEKLDDEYPELFHTLLDVLWPASIRPVPSLTILEYRPRQGSLQTVRHLPAGTTALSTQIGPDQVRCRFKTCYPVAMAPLTLKQVLSDRTPAGKPALRFKFALDPGIEFAKLELSEILIHIHSDPAAALQLHLSLCHDVESVLAFPGGVSLGTQELITPAGFREDESVLPSGRSVHPAYNLIHEYFAFREKFLFAKIGGLERLDLAKGVQEFDLQVVLRRPLPDGIRISEDSFRLHCTPAINLFPHDAEPLRVDHGRFSYRVIGSARQSSSFEIYSVESVTGLESGSGKIREYIPLTEFRFASAPDRLRSRTFTAQSYFGSSGRWETHLSLHGVELTNSAPVPENLSISSRATNGKLPRELNPNDVNVASDDSPTFATFGNLSKPTLPQYPPDREMYAWRLFRQLSHNHGSLSRTSELRDLLGLYDWSGQEANRRRIDGIHAVLVTPRDWLIDGSILRGVQITLEVQESNFAGKGDIHLFGLVLREFFRRYVTMNSVVELKIHMLPSQEEYTWPPETGTQTVL